jgi:hypothetical protein
MPPGETNIPPDTDLGTAGSRKSGGPHLGAPQGGSWFHKNSSAGTGKFRGRTVVLMKGSSVKGLNESSVLESGAGPAGVL